MSMQIRDGLKAITAAGTAERLVAADTLAAWLLIQGNAGNTGEVVVGGSTVVAAEGTRRGILLHPVATSVEMLPVFIPGPINLYDVWVDSTENGDLCHYIYLEP